MTDDAVSQQLAGTDALRALDDAYDAAWAVTDPDLLATCRDRIAMLLHHGSTVSALDEERRDLLASWPASSQLSAIERAALEFTEQYVVDVNGISEAQAEPLRDALGDDGFATFVSAMLVIEQRMTLDLALGAVA